MSEVAHEEDSGAQIYDLQAAREKRCAATPPGHQVNTQTDPETGLRVATCRKCRFSMPVKNR